MMQAYLDLVRKVPVYTIRFLGGLENLPQILDAIEQEIIHASLSTHDKGIDPSA
jgi:hypothetical protein